MKRMNFNKPFKRILGNRYFELTLVGVIALFFGWLLFHSSSTTIKNEKLSIKQSQTEVWTCAMHPQIRLDHPGKCPICGMDLIPLTRIEVVSEPGSIILTPEAMQMANVLTSDVTRGNPVKEVRLYGKVQADERLLQSQVSHISGRIDRLMVNFTGEAITKGQTIALIYSPELVTAQQELIEAAKTKGTQPGIYEAAREKLKFWKLTETQIEDIEKSGKVKSEFEIVSTTSGIVTERKVNVGDHVEEGTVIYNIADLSDVWIMFDAYESDLPFIEKGDRLDFTLQAIPGKKFFGTVMFIDPMVDPITRVTKVRVEVPNKAGELKPEMFATGIIRANLGNYKNQIVIPRSAVLWTGERSIVYVKQPGTDEPVFKMRNIELGPLLGNSYIVESGLSEGEKIVTSGAFSVDASAQLEGVPSMMNPAGEIVPPLPDEKMKLSHMNTGKSSSIDTGMAYHNKMKGMQTGGKEQGKEVSMDFIMQLDAVYDSYIDLKNAFFNGDEKSVSDKVIKFQKSISDVDMKLLTGQAHMKWMDILGNLNKQVSLAASSPDIKEQRIAFYRISDQMYKAIKLFGLMDRTLYYQFCPMANNNKGAYWLSETNQIRNPYFGSVMPTCGETKETLKFQ